VAGGEVAADRGGGGGGGGLGYGLGLPGGGSNGEEGERGQWRERPAARSPPVGVVVEAADLRVLGFEVRVRRSSMSSEPRRGRWGSRRTDDGGGSASGRGEAAW
jgi:hypothetical protein